MTTIQNSVNLRTIPGYSQYLISDCGTIYKLYNTETGLLCQQLQTKQSYNGYINVWLQSDSNEKQCFQVGRLVLMAFAYDSYFSGAECDHINHITTDNRIENLRWVSHSTNCKNRRVAKSEKDRPLYLMYDNGQVEMYCSRMTTNIPSATLSRIMSGKHSQKYKCTGFYWDQLHAQDKEV